MCLPSTNDFCESWRISFYKMLNNHPLKYNLIDELNNEQNRVDNNTIQLKSAMNTRENLNLSLKISEFTE